MATIRKNPLVNDYFVDQPDVVAGAKDIKPITALVEDSKVVTFTNFKIEIDYDFWANLDTSLLPGLAKLNTVVSDDGTSNADVTERMKRLAKAGVPPQIASQVSDQMGSVLKQLLPAYRQLFEGYRIIKGNVAWRLNNIYATKMHIDCYPQPIETHFARMFINLDSQPRIWHTSWRIADLLAKIRKKIPKSDVERLPPNDLWTELNKTAFGPTVNEWWQHVDKHAVFFAPGDIWVVDSRLIGHQIFYGRRAVSIDFVTDTSTMLNPEGHYLKRAEVARSILLQG